MALRLVHRHLCSCLPPHSSMPRGDTLFHLLSITHQLCQPLLAPKKMDITHYALWELPQMLSATNAPQQHAFPSAPTQLWLMVELWHPIAPLCSSTPVGSVLPPETYSEVWFSPSPSKEKAASGNDAWETHGFMAPVLHVK